VTDATRQAISTTLRALPSDDPPGRLTRALQPGGFEMLAGITPGARGRPAPAVKSGGRAASSKAAVAEPPAIGKRDAAKLARARAALEEASRERRVASAREALQEAEQGVHEAEREHAAASRKRDAAQSRAADAQNAYARARTRADAATADVEALERS
jgi:hypothetical protein